MTIREIEIILYVDNQARARDFYRSVLGLEATLDVPGMTEFQLAGATLGLMPRTGIRKLVGDVVNEKSAEAGCELYLRVDDAEMFAKRAIAHGARELSALTSRDWGDDVVYLADPDGHVLAFATRSA